MGARGLLGNVGPNTEFIVEKPVWGGYGAAGRI